MNIYTINSDYINYLKRFEPNILNIDNYNHKRPFIYVELNINDFLYYAPLSHIQKAKNKFTDFNIFYKNTKLGCIKINNMIPVSKNITLAKPISLNILNNDTISDKKYKRMLKRQIKYINANIDKINKKAKLIYKIGISKNRKDFINNFSLLEEKCKEYTKLIWQEIKTQQQDIEEDKNIPKM